MVEMGDLREGIYVKRCSCLYCEVLKLPSIQNRRDRYKLCLLWRGHPYRAKDACDFLPL